MDNIAAGSASDRRDLFQESASRLGMNPAIVEKDFWVCWILKLLFAEPALKNQMVFKGGTSLSKVFGLIDRFSEDIDLVLDWRLLRYDQAGANNPFQATSSKSKQSRYNLEMNTKAVAYIRDSKVAPFRLYDLRHTWATRAAMSGIDLVTLAAMLGHSRIQMVLRYAHPTQQHQHQAMEKLEQFVSEQRIAHAERTAPQTSYAIQ
jgi:hypothetical protein